ncbi:CPBP family intramembrane glutamic endopeptidase [Neobacillus niacini]|uniref:CPBP family intramembrane glutamic endopeptidase n=1 Tax=Neobacillus niacini TaxID=86668 RepID=UPI00300004D8
MHWGRVVLHSLMLVILFLLAAIFVNPLTDGIGNNTIRIVVKEVSRIGLTIGMLLWYGKFFLKKSSAYFRVGNLIVMGRVWVLVGLIMPITVITFYVLSQYVVFQGLETHSIKTIVTFIISSFITACSAGVIEEILFRGYLLKLFEDKWNTITAVSVTSILFSALHLLTMNGLRFIDVCLVLIAGTMAGIMFSLIVYKSGSVWNAVIVHVIWNFFMSSKIIQFVPIFGSNTSSLVKLTFSSDRFWITGGSFGIEAAFPVIVLYILIICWIIFYKTDFFKKNYTYKGK